MAASYWIGESQLDRWVTRSLTRFAGADLSEVHAEVCRMLREAGVVKTFQLLPDENDIWCALQRLVKAGYADKYVHETAESRSIHYRCRVMRR